MTSPESHREPARELVEEDDPMQEGVTHEDEGEGDANMPGISDDSSEEPEEDAEEERRIRDGFIVDEEEEEDGDDEEEERRQRRKRRKRRHRRQEDEDEVLEDDDLDLLEENTGAKFKKSRLTRLRRGRDSDTPPAASSSKRKTVVESSDDDLDDLNNDLPQVQDIKRIWDDDRGGREDDDEVDMDDMDNFIDYDDEEESGAAMDEDAKERKKEKRRMEKERWKAMGGRSDLAGIDANAWDEIHDVFGDGHTFDWALAGDEEGDAEEDRNKSEIKYNEVFEPSAIQSRMLTEDDELIRVRDIPERMQLATSSLSPEISLSFHEQLTEADLDGAAQWVTLRLSSRKTRDFFSPDGQFQHLQQSLVMAVTNALRFLFVQQFEVPYIWTHKRDYLSHFDEATMRSRSDLLNLSELWRVYALGQKYRSLVERRRALDATFARLDTKDDYFTEEVRQKADTVEFVADTVEWLSMKYKEKKEDAFVFRFHDDEQTREMKKHKTPSRKSAYEVAKKTIVSRLAQGFGIEPFQVATNFMMSEHTHFVEDQEVGPAVYAEQFTESNSDLQSTVPLLLAQARLIWATELGKDPQLRQAMRDFFKSDAYVSVVPTDRGMTKIDEHHPYFNFKYLYQKKASDMLGDTQFLHILNAEAKHLVIVTISLPPDSKAQFERRLNDAFASDSFSDTAKAWNEERSRIVVDVLENHLIPAGVKWTREWIREDAEETIAARCAGHLRARVDVAPYTNPNVRPGESASVLAISWGKGDPQKDAITLVFLDEAGRLREQTKVDNLGDPEPRDDFLDLIRRRRPDVIVIGGFTIATAKLTKRVKEMLSGQPLEGGDTLGGGGEPPQSNNDQSFNIPVIYVHDDVARIYQHSKRAAEEFSSFSPVAKYCVGLARYAQSPLNEFAALGSDMIAILFEEENQILISKEKQLAAFERVLVDVTNKVGVDINRAASDSYYQHLLPFVCGLGPRKAQHLIKKIASMGGNLINREQFIKNGLLTTKIFLNAAGFLRISNDPEMKHMKNRHSHEDDVPDPLDDTRIHPEDYELARKMATDALELDEEDVHDEHPSNVISLIMQDDDNEKKLSELNLDEFAVNMYEANEDRKRHTLNVIREELLKPFSEQRVAFPPVTDWEVLTMLTGETKRTLRIGLIVSMLVVRTKAHTVFVRLDSGIEGAISSQYVADYIPNNVEEVVKKGQTIPGVIVDIKMDLPSNTFSVELSSRPADVQAGDAQFRRVRHDDCWNHHLFEHDRDVQARKKRSENDRSRRVIKHPNFHNMNSSQAEAYLDKQQPGDVVIRPSSKGNDHLAVTWKVTDQLFQHIDVTEPNADPTGQTVGSQLIVDSVHKYADLDELIVNHIQAMARRVEELMAHEKFKHGSEEDLHLFLKNFVAANPAKSIYGFTLNRKRPGHFNICFLANKNSVVQTWPVRVAPEAYYLFDAPAAGVPELCDAFKVRHLHESQNLSGAGGKTPYGAGSRTPARTPGHATPGRMSVRQVGRTPGHYTGIPSATPAGIHNQPPSAPNTFGGATPGYGIPPQIPYGGGYHPNPPGYQTGSVPSVPSGMDPGRAAMIQSSGGWGPGNSGGW